MNNRGVGSVVATVLIILLVVVGVGILWAAVRSVLDSSSNQFQPDCLTIDLKVTSCIRDNTATGTVTVKISRKIGAGDLTGLKFAFVLSNGQTIVDDGTINALEELESAVFT